jgi:hypothetical protein
MFAELFSMSAEQANIKDGCTAVLNLYVSTKRWL